MPLHPPTRPLIPLIGGLLSWGLGCSPGGGIGSSAPDLTLQMERQATGLTTNALLLDFPEDTGYLFKIAATELSSTTVFDEFLPMQARVDLAYTTEGKHSVEVAIEQANGTPYITETLSWTYS